jgi:phosphate transport system substrate-binding protein
MLKLSFALIICGFVLYSCGNDPFAYDTDTHSRGYKVMFADEAFKPFLETASYTFEGLYPKSSVQFKYMSETNALNALIKDETKTIFVSRDFSESEKKKLAKSNIVARATLIGFDAIAFVGNKTLADSTFTVSELKAILLGKEKTTIVFDNVQSSNFNQLLSVLKIKAYGKNVKALNSNNAVIDYVRKHPEAIGVVGYNWLSDEEDPIIQFNRNEIKILSLAKNDKSSFVKPDTYSIRTNTYPFIKKMWCLNKGAADGLNTGFVNFLEDEKGQLLVEKAGLVAYRKTPRVFNFEFQ